MSIKKKLATGDDGEQQVIKLLKKANLLAIKNKDNTTRLYYDISIVFPEGHIITAEIKYDVYSDRSGNIAIEFFNTKQNKDSGINATTAALWFCVTPKHGIWVASTKVLRDYIKLNPPFKTITNGGDNNANFYLYKEKDLFSSIFVRCDKLNKCDLTIALEHLATHD